jgi:dTMP kinase
MTSVFIAVEGPNGVGKSTAIANAVSILNEQIRTPVHATREPSSTQLGAAIRALEPSLSPEALALACAADRLDHVMREIAPTLRSGSHVISDRYVPSSLVLQRLDGLERELIWRLNKSACPPDLTVYLDDEPETISQRLAARSRRSRFEADGSAELEISLFRETRAFLHAQGWRQAGIDCRNRTPEEVGSELARLIVELAGS